MTVGDRRNTVIVAGHRGDTAVAERHLDDPEPVVRAAALGALDRIGSLTDDRVAAAFDDDDAIVRRRAAELAAARPDVDLMPLVTDDDATVVEMAVWACGERDTVSDDLLAVVIDLTTDADEPLVREAGAAALGAIGDARGAPAVLVACGDKPHVRRRAVLALAPFAGDEIEAAIDRALTDRDWQVRQAAEDLRRAAGTVDLI
jgi:HEAT repeat protein